MQRSFLSNNDNNFYFLCLSNKALMNNDTTLGKYIGKYTLKNNRLIFSHFLNIESPNLYNNRDITFGFLNLYGGNYPFYIPKFGTQIINLETESTLDIDTKDFPKDETVFSLKNLGPKMDNLQSMPYSNHYTNVIGDNVYLYYSVEGEKKLKIINKKSAKDISIIELDKLNIPIKPYYPYFQINDETKMFLIEDNNGYIRGYDLDFINSFSQKT